LLCAKFNNSNLRQVRVEQSETTEPLAATARRASKASYPARPTNVKRRPKGAFLLCAKFNNSNLRQVRVEQSETTESLAATARRASKASYPASHHTYSLHPYCCFCTPRPPPLKHASSLIQRIVSSARGQRISLFTHDFP
jgi:hypothetical protein